MMNNDNIENIFGAMLAIEDAGQEDDPHVALARISAAINEYAKQQEQDPAQHDPRPAPDFTPTAVANAMSIDLFMRTRSAPEFPLAIADYLRDVDIEPLSPHGKTIIKLALKVVPPVTDEVPTCDGCGQKITLRATTVLAVIQHGRWVCSRCNSSRHLGTC
jgi:hypothetical protein